jgi:hypothetical protein
MTKAADPWNGQITDDTKAHLHADLKRRLAAEPALLGQIINRLKILIDPAVGSYDALMVDQERTWNTNLYTVPDDLHRQAAALWSLCHAGATHPSWWRRHHPDDKPAVPYPHGQANYLQDCIGLLLADGVNVPHDLRVYCNLKPRTVTP